MGCKAGIIGNCSQAWHGLPSDDRFLSWVKGYEITFIKEPPYTKEPGQTRTSTYSTRTYDWEAADSEIESIRRKGVLETSSHEEGEFISNLFLRPKKQEGNIQVIR